MVSPGELDRGVNGMRQRLELLATEATLHSNTLCFCLEDGEFQECLSKSVSYQQCKAYVCPARTTASMLSRSTVTPSPFTATDRTTLELIVNCHPLSQASPKSQTHHWYHRCLLHQYPAIRLSRISSSHRRHSTRHTFSSVVSLRLLTP